MVKAYLEGHSILKLIQEHLELAHTDDKVGQTELVLYIPAKRTKLQTFLQTAPGLCQHHYFLSCQYTSASANKNITVYTYVGVEGLRFNYNAHLNDHALLNAE